MRIVIDPGHRNSSFDFGATGANIKESVLALQIANLIADGFKNANHEVFFTRETEDQVISLDARIKKANRITSLDWYISIHINAAENTSAAGFEVWHYGDQEVISDKICKNVCSRTNQKNRGAKISTGFAVLKNTYCRAILIECGFISNPQERASLVTGDYQLEIANGILESFGINPISNQPDTPEDDSLTEIMLNGVIKKVKAIKQDGNNYIKLRDLEDNSIKIDYDSVAKMPIVQVRK